MKLTNSTLTPAKGWRRRIPLQLAFLIVVLAIWQGLEMVGLLSQVAVSSPTAILGELFSLQQSGQIWGNVAITLEETAIGYAAGMAVGCGLGFALAFFPRVMAVLQPYVNLANAVPRFALAPLFILWFGIGLVPKVALAFSLVVIIAFVNTLEGARSVDPEMRQIAQIFNASRWQLVTKLVLPSCVPWVFAAARLSIGYAVGGAIVGELFASEAGLGYLLASGENVNNSAEVFAALVLVVAIAGLLSAGAAAAERHFTRWRM